MGEFLELLASFWSRIFGLLMNVPIVIGSVTTSLFYFLFAVLATGMIISIFWGGAKT